MRVVSPDKVQQLRVLICCDPLSTRAGNSNVI